MARGLAMYQIQWYCIIAGAPIRVAGVCSTDVCFILFLFHGFLGVSAAYNLTR